MQILIIYAKQMNYTNINNKTQSRNTIYTYVWNISDVTFDNADTWIVEFGLNCNLKKKQWNLVLIIDTDSAITPFM